MGSTLASRIQQIVWNVVSNAIKFTHKGGTIDISLTHEESSHKLVIKDDGQGITPEILPFIFDRFRQADSSTRRKFGGLGLGLSIVKHLLEAHGGTIEVESAGQNCGATFTIQLPIRALKVIVDVAPQNVGISVDKALPKDTDEYPLSRLDDIQVLIVDDDPDARLMLLAALESLGAKVMAAVNADNAIDMLRAGLGQYDILISDIGMPDKDGFD